MNIELEKSIDEKDNNIKSNYIKEALQNGDLKANNSKKVSKQNLKKLMKKKEDQNFEQEFDENNTRGSENESNSIENNSDKNNNESEEISEGKKKNKQKLNDEKSQKIKNSKGDDNKKQKNKKSKDESYEVKKKHKNIRNDEKTSKKNKKQKKKTSDTEEENGSEYESEINEEEEIIEESSKGKKVDKKKRKLKKEKKKKEKEKKERKKKKIFQTEEEEEESEEKSNSSDDESEKQKRKKKLEKKLKKKRKRKKSESYSYEESEEEDENSSDKESSNEDEENSSKDDMKKIKGKKKRKNKIKKKYSSSMDEKEENKSEISSESEKEDDENELDSSSDSEEIIKYRPNKLLEEFKTKTKTISSILEFLDENYESIESSKCNNEYFNLIQELKKIIEEFKLKYYSYKNIERFSITVIGCVSAGKSTILNYLLKLKKTLEMDHGITTKCICIIRHKKGNKKAKLYEVKIVNRGGDEEKYKYNNFEKGKEIPNKDVAKVIKERNLLIAKNKISKTNFEKYFLIIEYEIPLFQGDFEKYGDLFEFMDVPGLNEESDINNDFNNKEKQNIEETNNSTTIHKEEKKKLSSIDTNFYFRQIFPLIKMNIKFSLFIFDAMSYSQENSVQILNTYLYGNINNNKLEMNNNNDDNNNRANFEEENCKKNSYFEKENFEKNSDFEKENFEKISDFEKENFEKNSDFENENFEKNSDYENLMNDLQKSHYKKQEEVDSIFNLKSLSLIKNIEENNESYDEEKEYKENIENKKFKEKIKQRGITFVNSFKKSIFILNKIDLIEKSERKEINDKFIKFIEKDFAKRNKIPKFNLSKENEIAINGKELNEEVSKFDSFEDYTYYYINNINEDEEKVYNFFEYLSLKMEKDFKNIKIDIEQESDNDSVNKKTLKHMKKKDYEHYKKIEKAYNKNAELIEFISKINYLQLKKKFKKNQSKYIIKKNKNGENLEDILKKKMVKIINDYLNIEKYIGIEKDVKQYLGIDANKNKQEIRKRIQKMKKELKGIENPKQTLYDIGEKIKNIYEINPKNNHILTSFNQYLEIKDYFENTSAIRFLAVGPHSSGKSTYLNRNIGYNHNYLPTSCSECTKICVIIKYCKKNEEAKLYETQLVINEEGYNYFKYDENCIVAEGEERIKDKIVELNNAPDAKTKLKYYLLKAPIELLDMMDLKEEEKEKIELIDFPGLDTDFENAKEEAKYLLRIIDGFIYINYKITFHDDDKKILKLIYETISQRRTFSFDTCLFILNKMDEFKDDVPLDEIKYKILETFNEQNINLKSTEVLEKNERIGDKNLTLTPFSCEYYKNYKTLENNLNHFEQFISDNKEKPKSNNFFDKGIISFQNFINYDNKISNIKNNLKEKYISTSLINKFNPNEKEVNLYLDILKNIDWIKDEKPKIKDLTEIVKYFLFIKKNKKATKIYRLSNIQILLKNYKIVIKNTLQFVHKKQMMEILDFLGKIYLDMLKCFTIIKMRLNDKNLENFRNINEDELYNDINKQSNRVMKDINDKIEDAENYIKFNLSCKSEDDFKKTVEINKNILDRLIKKIRELCDDYKDSLKEKNNEIIIKILKLKEFKEKREEFKKKLNDFKSATMKNDVSSDSRKYIKTESHWYLLFIPLFSKDQTLKEYKNKIDSFFEQTKDKSKEIIKENTIKAKENIQQIINLFNVDIKGYEGKIDLFKKRLEELEEFIYISLGIN